MTYLFTKTVSRRPEYNSLVEEFEDYDEEEIQNLEEVKEECKRKKYSINYSSKIGVLYEYN